MAKIGRKRLARELVRLLQEQPNRRQQLLQQTAAYLLDTHQANNVHLLINDIADELMRTQHSVSAEVRTAFGLDANSRQAVTDLLTRATGAQRVELTEVTEPDLLGGIVIRTPQLELDASVKRQLTQLVGGIQ